METKEMLNSKKFTAGFVIILIASILQILQAGFAFGKWLAENNN